MANPFSAVPTPYRVQADGRSWFANCAWDAFGICAALHVDGRIETVVPRLRRGAEHRGARAAARRREPPLPLPRPRRPLVGRHRLHLKRDEPLPVGGAHRALARRSRPGCDDLRGQAERARARLVERPPAARVAAAHARAEPGGARRTGSDRPVLAAAVAAVTRAGRATARIGPWTRDSRCSWSGPCWRRASWSRSARRARGCPCSSRSSDSGCCSGRTGPGGIEFDDAELARQVGVVGLALILYEGGLQTSWRRLRQVAVPAALLSTVGVVVSAILTGVAAHAALRPLLARGDPARRRRRLHRRRRGLRDACASRTSGGGSRGRSRRSRAATTRWRSR